MAKNRGFVGELWNFVKLRKKWWLVPVIVLLILVSVLIIVAQSSVLSPFIYSLI